MNSRRLKLNDHPEKTGRCVVYVMARDQRAHDNHALLEAQSQSKELGLPLAVLFNVLPKVGHASLEHYLFMLEGLRELQSELARYNIPFFLSYGDMVTSVTQMLTRLEPASVIFDFSPLSGPRKAQKQLAQSLRVPVYVVDTHNNIPTWLASDKEEFAAHTFRHKVHKKLSDWLVEPAKLLPHPFKLDSSDNGLSFEEIEKKLSMLPSCGINLDFRSGEQAARAALESFIANRLEGYGTDRNNPNLDGQSGLSPYIHYGQLSSLRIALELQRLSTNLLLLKEPKLVQIDSQPTRDQSINALLEELIVRKELADNYCFYNPSYRSLAGAKDWARTTLNAHRSDPRQHTYSLKDFEKGQTHDQAWNAAQKQLITTGKIHGYMRMYWAKKILEWSESPDQAIQTAIYLNDHYSIDGRDPNGYVGILWSIAGLHDRPWFERDIYGKIRYMNENGLKKKFNIDKYIEGQLKRG